MDREEKNLFDVDDEVGFVAGAGVLRPRGFTRLTVPHRIVPEIYL